MDWHLCGKSPIDDTLYYSARYVVFDAVAALPSNVVFSINYGILRAKIPMIDSKWCMFKLGIEHCLEKLLLFKTVALT